MANRYWVGGGSDWDGVAGTKWATTSGGAGGASVPTSADDVFLDAGSAGGSCFITTGNTGAKSITCTGYTGFLLIINPIEIFGSLTLSSGMTFNSQSLITFKGTGTITSAGQMLPSVTIDGVGIVVSLGDDFATRPSSFSLFFPFNVLQGTFSTNNFNDIPLPATLSA